jgi:hypothetical protein
MSLSNSATLNYYPMFFTSRLKLRVNWFIVWPTVINHFSIICLLFLVNMTISTTTITRHTGNKYQYTWCNANNCSNIHHTINSWILALWYCSTIFYNGLTFVTIFYFTLISHKISGMWNQISIFIINQHF